MSFLFNSNFKNYIHFNFHLYLKPASLFLKENFEYLDSQPHRNFHYIYNLAHLALGHIFPSGHEKKSESYLHSHVWLFVIPWTAACSTPPSMEFFRQEYWSGVPFPSLRIFLTQGLNLGLPYCRQMLYHQGGAPELRGRMKSAGALMREVASLGIQAGKGWLQWVDSANLHGDI